MAVKPSLALIPSGVKQNKVYSVLPSNGDGDFTFSRSGNATRVNKDGFIEVVGSGVPRLNYPLIEGEVSGCPSLLLEPERRNYIPYSEDFSQYSDSLGADIFSNTTISPDGTLNASTIGFGGSDNSRIFINTSTSSSTYIFSLYVKSDTSKKFRFRISDTSGTTFSDDLQTTTKWKRFTFEFTGDPSTCAICNSSDAISGSIDIFGFQLEQGSFPTSYIPNYGTAAGVTRSAETANGAGNSNVFNSEEGVLYAEISALADDLTNRQMTLSDGTNDNRLILKYDNQSNVIQSFNRVSGVESAFLSANISDITLFSKCLIKYKENDYQLWINGYKLDADNASTVWSPSTLNDLKINDGGGSDFFGNIKQLQYFNTALTDAELEKLTSYDSFRDMAIAGQYKTY